MQFDIDRAEKEGFMFGECKCEVLRRGLKSSNGLTVAVLIHYPGHDAASTMTEGGNCSGTQATNLPKKRYYLIYDYDNGIICGQRFTDVDKRVVFENGLPATAKIIKRFSKEES
ncbi:MAG: hypothetical protein V3W52_17085 [Syntrophobacteria bacterium]